MKKALAVQIEFDHMDVRRAVALITGENITDEDIIKRFYERVPVKVDYENNLDESESFTMCASFVAMIIEQEIKENTDKSL